MNELYERFTHDQRKRLAERNGHVKMVTKTIVKGKVRVLPAPDFRILFLQI